MKLAIALLLLLPAAFAATFGTIVPINGGPTDLVLDESRGRLYIVNSTQNRIEVYSTAQRRLLDPIPTGAFPLKAALSRDRSLLYVTVYDAGRLEVYDLESGTLTKRVTLPAPPEGIAVGGDDRVLITTTGVNAQTSDGRLVLYDPFATEGDSLRNIVTTLPPPAAPQIPTAPTQIYNTSRSHLEASQDGRYIIGLNNPNTSSRLVFVYEVASASVLRSRTVTSLSSVLSVAPDGSRFMAGLSLFDTETLAILAQQNTANSLYPFPNNANFNTQQVQGGSLFSPDGGVLYAAFNITPVQQPAARANSSQLMLSDPENLLIQLGLQLPENLTGKMVATSDGATVYALSQSGFLTIPISTVNNSPLAVVERQAVLLANDQCAVNRDRNTARVEVRNGGRGQMTVQAQVLQTGVTFTFPLAGGPGGGGAGAPPQGPGGGAPGGQIPIILPGGGGTVMIPPGQQPGAGGGNLANTATQQTAIANNAPRVTVRQGAAGATIEFALNTSATTSLGTGTPTDFLVQSPQAINIPSRVRVYQNNRNAEATGTVLEIPISISTAEGLTDIVFDSRRERLYIANSGLNRVEVFDIASQSLLTPIKVGQLPRSLALHANLDMLFVANTGGESISIIDLDAMQISDRVKFPPVPYNASFALNTPAVIAYGLSGLQVLMSNGQLWRISSNEALPRPTSRVLGTATLQTPRTMAATPGGEFILLLAGNGMAYLYDATSDEFSLSQTVATTPIQGYYGPIAAGPRGQYYFVNGTLLNSSLSPTGTLAATSPSPVAGLTAVNATTVARFVQPARTNANAAVTTAPSIELVDINTGLPRNSAPAIEGPLSVQTGTQRVNVGARTMVVDPEGINAYVLTATGLSIIPLATPPVQTRPAVNNNGVVNGATMASGVTPGSIVAILGRNLGEEASVNSGALPTLLGGVCVTLNNRPLPLLMTSPTQINAQIPPDLAAGRYPLIVRSIGKNVATIQQTVTVAKYAPAVYMLPSGVPAIYHPNGTPVSKSQKAKRDQPLTMMATGLGPTTGASVTAGEPSPAGAVTDKVRVYFGDPRIKEAEVIVEWAGLAEGLVGIYKIDLRVPGARVRGDDLPVTIRIGGVDSPQTGTNPPRVSVE